MPMPFDGSMSLRRLKDDLPLIPFELLTGGGDEGFGDELRGLRPMLQGRSSRRTRDDFGKASWRSFSSPSMRAKTSRVLSRSSF